MVGVSLPKSLRNHVRLLMFSQPLSLFHRYICNAPCQQCCALCGFALFLFPVAIPSASRSDFPDCTANFVVGKVRFGVEASVLVVLQYKKAPE